MNIIQLRSFVEIVDNKSFSKAAKKLGISQPALSMQLQALEEELDTKLLDRTTKTIKLTKTGRETYKYAKKIISEQKNLLKAIRIEEEIVKGKINICGSTIPGEQVLPFIIGGFKKLYRQSDIKLFISDSLKVIDAVKNGIYDIGVVGVKIKNEDLDFKELLDDNLIFIASNEFVKQSGNIFKLNDIKNIPFILREEGSGTRLTFERQLQKHKLSIDDLNIALVLGSSQAVINAAQANLGITIVSRFAARRALQCEEISEIKFKNLIVKRKLYLVRNKKIEITPLLNKFINFILSYSSSNLIHNLYGS
jgi:DNA-binding transcriptional LysR family regulator